jgi:hypothetical protein
MRSLRLVLVAVAVGSLGACVDNDRSLTITHFVPPTSGSSGCVIDSAGMLSITQGTWDLDVATGLGLGYELFFAIANQLMAVTTTSGTPTVDNQAFYVNSYDVTLEPIGAIEAGLPASKRSFNVATGTQRLAPGDKAGASVEAISPELVPGLAAVSGTPLGSIIAHVRPVATRANEQVVGAYVGFPIRVCKGCLSNSVNGAFPACPLPKGSTVEVGNGCNLSQEEPVTCCAASPQLLCGAAAPLAP